MKQAKFGAVFMIAVIALASCGVAYAHWWDYVQINVKADMGRLGFGFVEQYTNDPGPNYEDPDGVLKPIDSPNDGTYDPDCPTDTRECDTNYKPYPPAPKNVAKTDCVMSKEKYWHDGTLMEHEYPPDSGEFETCHDLITVTLHNVYPNYAPNLYFYIANAGCVPVDILGHWLIDDGIPGNGFADGIDFPLTWFYMELGTVYQIDLNDDADNDPDIEMCLFRLADDPQLDPCDRDLYGVGFHILQPYPQCTTLEFELKLYGVQWNWPVIPPYLPVDPDNPDLPQIP
jgi:hypothetical protein